jgi:hypothetical protein
MWYVILVVVIFAAGYLVGYKSYPWLNKLETKANNALNELKK